MDSWSRSFLFMFGISPRLSALLSYYLLCMLYKVHPRILCYIPFLSAIALICLCPCCLLIMLSTYCTLLAIRLSFRLAYVPVLCTNTFACLHHCILFLAFSSRISVLPRSLLAFENFHIQICFSYYYPCSVHIAVSLVHRYVLSNSIHIHIHMLRCPACHAL